MSYSEHNLGLLDTCTTKGLVNIYITNSESRAWSTDYALCPMSCTSAYVGRYQVPRVISHSSCIAVDNLKKNAGDNRRGLLLCFHAGA